jgi:hypothetical protein
MNATDELKKAHAGVWAEEKRLEAELAKVRAVRVALEAGMNAKPGTKPVEPKAPAGTLKGYILNALSIAKRPMSNGELREMMAEANYKFSLTPLHVSKTLTKLLKARKVVRIGEGSMCKYRLAGKA